MSASPSAMRKILPQLQASAAYVSGYMLPAPVQSLAARALGYTHPHKGLLSELKLAVAVRERMGQFQFLSDKPVRDRNRFTQEMVALQRKKTTVAHTRDFSIDTPNGPITLRHYLPTSTHENQTLLLFIHGGGFVVGNIDTHDEACRIFCHYGDMQVLSVDYRLSPEHPAPAAVEDCFAALQWAYAHAAELGVNPQKIAVGGDSAGGSLSAVMAQLAKQHAIPLAAQLLIYPTIDAVNTYPSHIKFAKGLFLSSEDMRLAKMYYTQHSPLPLDDFRLSPINGDLSQLAPAIVITSEFDTLNDEGKAYAEGLKAAGTPVTYQCIAGQAHGFINFTNISPASKQHTTDMARQLSHLLRAAD